MNLDLNITTILGVAIAAYMVYAGVPGAKERLIEAFKALFRIKSPEAAVVVQDAKPDCKECFAAWDILKTHAEEHGNAVALKQLTELLPNLFGAQVPEAK